MIKVLFFAQLREQLNSDGIEVNITDSCTVEALRDRILEENPQWEMVFKHSLMLCSVNQSLVDFGTSVSSGDEVAFFPPVTGG